MPALDGPPVTVLIAAYNNAGTIGDTLGALRRQTRPPHQVIVVASGTDDTARGVRERFPEAELIVSEARLYPGAARNRGLPRVTGGVVACLDADCVPDPDWIERIVDAIVRGHPAVGGAVLNAVDSDDLGWACYLSEFSLWLPGRPRALRDTPTCNAAYRAGLIEEVGGFTEEPLLSADSLFHWCLRERLRVPLRFEPSMRVRHCYRGTARAFLARRFEHGRSLAAARRLFGLDHPAWRLFWAVSGLVLLPPFYVVRLLVQALGHPDVPTGALVRALPLTVAGLTLWAWGQADGAVRARRATRSGSDPLPNGVGETAPAAPSLSVVVTTHNGQSLLGTCLDALSAQTVPPLEVLVVDDGSPSDDAAWVGRRYPRVRTLRLPKNLGHAGAAAAGMAEARGDLVALVNNDAAPDPDWCEQAVRPFADPAVGSVATRLVLFDEPGTIDSAGDAYTTVGEAYKRLDGEADPGTLTPGPTFSACAGAAVYRRAALDSCGGIDPRLEAYYDDVDLGFRLRLAGWSCVYAPAARCRHRVSASYGRGSWRQLFLASRNASWVYWSDMPGTLLLLGLPGHVVFFVLRCLSRLGHGGLLPFLAGKAAAARDVRGLLARRRRVQSLRRVPPAAIRGVLDPAWFRHSMGRLFLHHGKAGRRRSLRPEAADGRGA